MKLKDIFENPISGEWGKEVGEGEKGSKVIRTTNFTNIGRLDLSSVVERDIDLIKNENKKLKFGDIIIEKSGGSPTQPVGRVVIFEETNDEVYFCNNFTSILRPNKNIVPKFGLYLLKDLYNKKKVLKFQNKTTGIINIKLNDYLNNTEITIPNLEVQNRIIEVLNKTQELIDKRKEQIESLDELVKSKFIEMFGDPVKNPLGWELKPFLDSGNCKNGMNFSASESGVELQYVGVGDFKDLSKIDNVNALGKVSLNKIPSNEYILQDGDILFVRSNGNKDLVGRCLAIYPNGVPTTYSGFCIRYRKTDDKLEIPYLLQVLKTDSMRKNMAGRGANIQNLNQQILGSLMIPVPPIELQNQFTNFIEHVDKLKFEMEKSLKDLEDNFNSLMQKAFKGELFN
ncbi:TPA: restriction endonuclease subunit S [Clostridium perfringens]|nr:restriction endonuclease subunit S [Clostridium perfringens]HAT4301217.1 restriction endonuclease subunit S [Clostridium perfringens]